MRIPSLTLTHHDTHPSEECALVDQGLGAFNDAAAPLHEVQAIACFARGPDGKVLGGAVGRRWGSCCELQQLWVEPANRRQGIASALIRTFEAHAASHGCTAFYLETFSFQAPSLYLGLGYAVEYERAVYPHGIIKYHMGKQTTPSQGTQ